MRKSVEIFANCMELELQNHDDESGWDDSELSFLLDRLNENVKELNEVSKTYFIDIGDCKMMNKIQRKTLLDIANYCMMLHENMGKKLYIEGE